MRAERGRADHRDRPVGTLAGGADAARVCGASRTAASTRTPMPSSASPARAAHPVVAEGGVEEALRAELRHLARAHAAAAAGLVDRVGQVA